MKMGFFYCDGFILIGHKKSLLRSCFFSFQNETTRGFVWISWYSFLDTNIIFFEQKICRATRLFRSWNSNYQMSFVRWVFVFISGKHNLLTYKNHEDVLLLTICKNQNEWRMTNVPSAKWKRHYLQNFIWRCKHEVLTWVWEFEQGCLDH